MEVTVQDAKTQLSRLLRRVEAGETVTIRRGKKPVARLVRIESPEGERKIWGNLEGRLTAEFDEPLSDFDDHM